MSRIGKRILTIPEKVNVELNGQNLTVKGPKGELSLVIDKNIKVNVKDNEITVEVLNNLKHTNEMHGTTNANIRNMLIRRLYKRIRDCWCWLSFYSKRKSINCSRW